MCIVKNWPQSGTGFRRDGKPDMILYKQGNNLSSLMMLGCFVRPGLHEFAEKSFPIRCAQDMRQKLFLCPSPM